MISAVVHSATVERHLSHTSLATRQGGDWVGVLIERYVNHKLKILQNALEFLCVLGPGP